MNPALAALTGGILIGLASTLLLLFNGRIAGISGIASGLLLPSKGELGWRAAFILGLVAGGILLRLLFPQAVGAPVATSTGVVIVAGLLVGVGTRMGNGCTSGHGVCGLARGSSRSLAATLTFMASGAITVFVVRHILGGI
jgi:uncharacterized membrane protein YedE/YeeE